MNIFKHLGNLTGAPLGKLERIQRLIRRVQDKMHNTMPKVDRAFTEIGNPYNTGASNDAVEIANSIRSNAFKRTERLRGMGASVAKGNRRKAGGGLMAALGLGTAGIAATREKASNINVNPFTAPRYDEYGYQTNQPEHQGGTGLMYPPDMTGAPGSTQEVGQGDQDAVAGASGEVAGEGAGEGEGGYEANILNPGGIGAMLAAGKFAPALVKGKLLQGLVKGLPAAAAVNPSQWAHAYSRVTDPDNTPRYRVPSTTEAGMSAAGAIFKAPLSIASSALAEGADFAFNGIPDKEIITGTSNPYQYTDLNNKDSYAGTYALNNDPNDGWGGTLAKGMGGSLGSVLSSPMNVYHHFKTNLNRGSEVADELGRLTGKTPGWFDRAAGGSEASMMRKINKIRRSKGQADYSFPGMPKKVDPFAITPEIKARWAKEDAAKAQQAAQKAKGYDYSQSSPEEMRRMKQYQASNPAPRSAAPAPGSVAPAPRPAAPAPRPVAPATRSAATTPAAATPAAATPAAGGGPMAGPINRIVTTHRADNARRAAGGVWTDSDDPEWGDRKGRWVYPGNVQRSATQPAPAAPVTRPSAPAPRPVPKPAAPKSPPAAADAVRASFDRIVKATREDAARRGAGGVWNDSKGDTKGFWQYPGGKQRSATQPFPTPLGGTPPVPSAPWNKTPPAAPQPQAQAPKPWSTPKPFRGIPPSAP
jgi:hypothetical protein